MNTDQGKEVMQTIASMGQNTKAVYDMIEEMGGERPENENLENMAEAILSISGIVTLKAFKRALDNGTAPTKYPVGTEIDDTYDGHSNPLIVAQYLDNSNNSSYGGAVGVILVRKFVEPTSQVFGNSNNYAVSVLKTLLDTTYLNNCSDALRAVISEINIPVNRSTVAARWFTMSCYEVCNQGANGVTGYEGIMWDYWKQKTGLNSPDIFGGQKYGRATDGLDGEKKSYWLRSMASTNVAYIDFNGTATSQAPNLPNAVLPACFIAKS